MKTNFVPAIIMLVAGLVDCILAIRERLPLFDFTKQLLLVLVIFYIIGCAAKLALDISFREKEQEDFELSGGALLDDAVLMEETEPEELSDEEPMPELENINAEENDE